jgi:eukaryotic-like serine/threonine-protein kinase
VKSETLEGRRWIGRVLRDRWRIDARISRGGVGTVYAATHKNNGSRAAIKVLHPEFSRDEDTRSRFLQEGYAANQVNHPGVVRILDDDTSEDGHAYLVMELLEGELLETRRIRKGGKLPLSDVYEVGEQLLDVLASAHDKGIVHRDIKPDNLFITQEGRLKVLDFGFAQMRSQFRPDVTATGFLLGTPGFMSPEQAVGNRAQVDAQTDIWAVGATLFTLISGEPVHDGQSAAEMLVAAANFPPRSLATVTSGLPQRLIELVDRAVAFDKATRWPNSRSMQQALRKVSGKQQAGAVSRRSIPDIEPVSDGPTLCADPMFIEELDPSELVDSQSASWPNERTVMADTSRRMPAAALPSGITREVRSPITQRPHPADLDGDTVAVPSSTTDPTELAPQTQPPQTPHMSPYSNARTPNPMVDPALDGGTLIMEGPVRDDTSGSGAYPSMDPGPKRSAFDHRATLPLGQSMGPSTPQHFAAQDSRALAQDASRTEEAIYGTTTSPPRTAPRRSHRGPSRALVFVGVAVVTMVIVIVAGLLILTFSD